MNRRYGFCAALADATGQAWIPCAPAHGRRPGVWPPWPVANWTARLPATSMSRYDDRRSEHRFVHAETAAIGATFPRGRWPLLALEEAPRTCRRPPVAHVNRHGRRC